MPLPILLLFSFHLYSADSSEIIGSLLARGDLEFIHLQYPAAISRYDSVLALESRNVEALWRLARAYVTLGEVAPNSERELLYRNSEHYARLCIVQDSLRAEGYTWLAAALGNIALFVGGSTKVRLAHEIRAELDKALAIRKDDDATYSILGSFHHSVGSVGWIERQMAALLLESVPEGSYEESEAAFRRAIELAPEVPRHRYELGMLYLDWGREREAKQMFESALVLPITAAGDTVARKRMLEVLDNLE
jgi:tetratricopeptide (TPR) repeat protein